MTIKHIIRREATTSRPDFALNRGRQNKSLGDIPSLEMSAALRRSRESSVDMQRLDTLMRTTGKTFFYLLGRLYGSQPIELGFGDKIVHIVITNNSTRGQT